MAARRCAGARCLRLAHRHGQGGMAKNLLEGRQVLSGHHEVASEGVSRTWKGHLGSAVTATLPSAVRRTSRTRRAVRPVVLTAAPASRVMRPLSSQASSEPLRATHAVPGPGFAAAPASRRRLRARRQAAEHTVCRPHSSTRSQTGHRREPTTSVRTLSAGTSGREVGATLGTAPIDALSERPASPRAPPAAGLSDEVDAQAEGTLPKPRPGRGH